MWPQPLTGARLLTTVGNRVEMDEPMRHVEATAAAERADAADRFSEWMAPHWAAMTALAQRLAKRGHADDVGREALALAQRCA